MSQHKVDISTIPHIITYPPATGVAVQTIEDLMAVKFPNGYKEVLMNTNGLSNGNGLVIYSTNEIIERNEIWEVVEYAAGYVAIGDDGGGNVFLMLQGCEEKAVFVVGAGDMNPNHATIVTTDFLNWVNDGCLSEQSEIVEQPDVCAIILVKMPDGGLKDVLKIKNVLGIAISTADLVKGSRNLPFTLIKRFPTGKAKKLLAQLGSIGETVSVKFPD